MTRQLYDRRWTVRAGVPGQTAAEWTAPLALRFSVDLTPSRGTNKASISLYNLSPEQRGRAEQAGAYVTLSAGYADTFGLIFTGSIAKQGVVTSYDPPDRVTTIEAGEGELEIQSTQIRKGWAPGVRSVDLLRAVASSMGIGLRDADQIPSITYGLGWAHAGRADAALDALTRDIGARWSIQAGQLQVLTGEQTTSDPIVLLRRDSGLVGAASPAAGKVEATSLLQPALRPGGRVQIESLTVSGQYRIDEVRHEGESRGGPWYSHVKASEVS